MSQSNHKTAELHIEVLGQPLVTMVRDDFMAIEEIN